MTATLRSVRELGRRDGMARRWLLFVVVACLLGVQALGFRHGIVHADRGDPARSMSSIAAGTLQAVGEATGLFASHDDPGECRLFDALGQQHGPASATADPLPAPMPCMARQRLQAGAFVARWAALFDARGPPPSH